MSWRKASLGLKSLTVHFAWVWRHKSFIETKTRSNKFTVIRLVISTILWNVVHIQWCVSKEIFREMINVSLMTLSYSIVYSSRKVLRYKQALHKWIHMFNLNCNTKYSKLETSILVTVIILQIIAMTDNNKTLKLYNLICNRMQIIRSRWFNCCLFMSLTISKIYYLHCRDKIDTNRDKKAMN